MAPKTKTKKRTYKKRTFKKRSPGIQKSLANVGQGFPKKMLMTHKYSDIVPLSSIAGNLARYHFHANSMYDPDYTSSGHQPMFRDQLSLLYNRYTVIGSKIKIKMCHGGSGNVTASVGCYVNDDVATGPSLFYGMMEQPTAKHCIIPASQDDTCNFTLKWSAKKNFGKGVMANNDAGALVGANPVETAVFTLWHQPNDLTTSQTIYAEVMIEFICIWTELKDVESS